MLVFCYPLPSQKNHPVCMRSQEAVLYKFRFDSCRFVQEYLRAETAAPRYAVKMELCEK
ncbi:hypothetical protein KIN20_034617 [Parelaphostrongylus tenuis]|uniref:Uncharacterized protein n=1 Tax=Parelaphostrongylus tenuis TaxID=148309 RepID=A0AAD5RCU0_PARTN|nr:hypothetical protein KIN20_034617 [Parelaphostrongylus tenuis]